MNLKNFNGFLFENKLNNIEIEALHESNVSHEDVDWTNVCKNEFPTELDKILASINSLEWEPVSGSKPMGPALAIKSVIKEFKIPKVSLVAYNGTPFGTKDEPGAAYSVFGIEATYTNGKYRLFFVDCGSEIIPVGGVKNDAELKESMNLNGMYKKMVKFLDTFPDNATSWSQAAGDELRDMARTAREYHTEYDLDMTYDEWETNPDAPQPLDFSKLKTPSERNTQGKKYIIDMVNKMGDQAKENFFDDYKHWFK